MHPFLFFLGTSLISVVCVALAIGLSWIAVVTSAGYLRILSFSGLPLFVSSLEGEVVCISGLSDILFLINHQGAPINGFLFFSGCFYSSIARLTCVFCLRRAMSRLHLV